MKDNVKYFKCECLCSVLVVEIEDYEDCGIKDTCFVLYERYGNRYPLWHKLKNCYRILFHGTPYKDQIIMHREQALELAQYIQDGYKEKEATQ